MLLKPRDMQTRTHWPTCIAKTHRYRLAHKKLYSGFLCHLCYIGQLVFVVRSVKDTLNMTLMWHHFSIVTCGLATLKETLCVRRSVCLSRFSWKRKNVHLWYCSCDCPEKGWVRWGWGLDAAVHVSGSGTLLWARVTCWRLMWILFWPNVTFARLAIFK